MGLWSKNSENKSSKICITLLRLILLLIYLPMYLSSNCIVLVFSLSLPSFCPLYFLNPYLSCCYIYYPLCLSMETYMFCTTWSISHL